MPVVLIRTVAFAAEAVPPKVCWAREIDWVGSRTYPSLRRKSKSAPRQEVVALFVRPLLHSPFRMMLPEKKPVVPLLPICSTSVPTALNWAPAPALTTTVGTLS